jgi:ribonuclease P protein component
MKFKQIKKNREFVRGYKRGDCYIYPELVIYILKNSYGEIRTGITSSKKTGKAVKRNRARRVLRRALSRITFDRRQSFDIILVARGKTAHMKSYQITPLIKERMTRSGIIYDQ